MQSHLPSVLTWRDAFLFPVRTPEARRDMLTGALVLLLLLPFGWILNLGHRLNVVHRLYKGESPFFRGFAPWGATFWRGCVSATAIFFYLLPANTAFVGAWVCRTTAAYRPLLASGAAAFVLGVFTLPGCMTVFAVEGEATILRQPIRAFRRAWSHRSNYLRAWGISLAAISLSFLGFAGLVVGFFFTSVWAWQVVGYAFTVALYGENNDGN